VSAYSSLTLDIIGIAALGVELQNLTSHSRFHECYKGVFDPPLLGQVLMAINVFVPIRWLPLEENRSFKQSNNEVRRLTREIVRQRMADFREEKPDIEDRNDILTHIIRESLAAKKPWTEEEILNQVG